LKLVTKRHEIDVILVCLFMYHKRKDTCYRPLVYNVVYLEKGNHLKVFSSDVRHVLYIAAEFLNTTAISDPDVIRCVLLMFLSRASSPLISLPRTANLIPN
jgi:hypothetical protein